MTKRELFKTTSGWTGTKFEVLVSSKNAILLSLKRDRRIAYQVIDYTDSYPDKPSELSELNPFRTISLDAAKGNYSRRNQLRT